MPFFVEEVVAKADVGYYIHGLFIEGATWENGGQDQEGYLIPSKLGERKPRFPVINCVAVIIAELRKDS